ncbi:MAG: VCBS repeat-containing protein, partial [Lentisphaerae bacterium]|nr:VCBS repeat-containing protein [Lentisphaerota bacterium]
STVHLSADADSGLPVSFSVGSGPGTISLNTNLTFIATGVVSIVASQTGNNFYAAAPALTNTFSVLPAPVQDGWLAIIVTPLSGSWALSAPGGYSGPSSGTGNLAAVSAPTGLYSLAWGALAGYVAPSNQTGFVTGGSTTIIAGVYLQILTNIGAPSGVSATEGSYTNRIRITWQGVAGATGYEIWRSLTNDPDMAGPIADVPAGQSARGQRSAVSGQPTVYSLQSTAYYYDDYAINPINAYYYWVRAKTATLISPMSYVSMGYAALAPEQKTGTADISVSDFVYLPVNILQLANPGTISCRLANLGPDALTSAGVAFDFHMARSAPQVVGITLSDVGAAPPVAGLGEAGPGSATPATTAGPGSATPATTAGPGSTTPATDAVWIGSAQTNLTIAAGGEELIILTLAAKRGLTVRGDLSGVQTAIVTVRHLSALDDPNQANNTTEAAGSVRIKTSGVSSIGRAFNDYDGDGKSDGCLYQSSLGRWYLKLSGDRYDADISVGDVGLGWTSVPGDYDGDGITDLAVYDRLNGWWSVRRSSTEQAISGQLGGPEYTATPCDFDGDGLTDPVVYRDADGYWYGASSAEGYALKEAPGLWPGYAPVPGDYDGDGKAGPAVYNQETGTWVIGPSSMGYYRVTGGFGGPGCL